MDESIELRRKDILSRMSCISSMRKGVISDYYVKTKLKCGDTKDNGPYYSLTSKGPNGKTVGEKIPSDLVEFIKAETENYKLYRELSDEYISVCVQQSISISPNSVEADKAKKNKKSK
jgi:hypothetical protein